MRRAAHAVIDLKALRHNFKRVRGLAPASRVMAVIKADAYGHGMVTVAHALRKEADSFAVACVPEALSLRAAGISLPIVSLQGFNGAQQLSAAAEQRIHLVLHHPQQLRTLETVSLNHPVKVWLKIDSGMHRLGFSPHYLADIHHRVIKLNSVSKPVGLMTHLACADDRSSPYTRHQLEIFDTVVRRLEGEHSIANSAGVLGNPDSHRDWVRPGIMLYGASPFSDGNAAQEDLKSVMTLKAPLISVKQVRKGDAVGYGGTFICPQDMPVGVAAIGYGDGYPRHAASGTPVLINAQKTRLIGRISMDMLTVDLRGLRNVGLGDEVILWGQGLPVDDIARCAGTISYELLCNVGNRAYTIVQG
jgi:alanine racemase